MIVLSTLIEAMATILHMVVTLYTWIIIITALLSFVRPDPYNPVVQTLYRLTEPVYAIIRKRINTVYGNLDLAPIIVILALQFFDLFIVKLLYGFASKL